MANLFKAVGVIASVIAIYEVGRARGEREMYEIARKLYSKEVKNAN